MLNSTELKKLKIALDALTGGNYGLKVWTSYSENPAKAKTLIAMWEKAGGTLTESKIDSSETLANNPEWWE